MFIYFFNLTLHGTLKTLFYISK